MRRSYLLPVLFSLSTVGCVDPLRGSWEADDLNQCGERDNFVVEEQLMGDGTFWALDTNGGCLECDFDLEMEPLGDRQYDGEIEFEQCTCGESRKADFECSLADDGLLTCDISWAGTQGACLSGEQIFKRAR